VSEVSEVYGKLQIRRDIMDLQKFMKVSERYLSHDPLAVIADKNKHFFYYIQDVLKQDRTVKIQKDPKGTRRIA